MTSKKEILKILTAAKIPFIVIGGIALRIYGSPRVTHDIDLAIRAPDADQVIETMYMRGYFLVKSADTGHAFLAEAAVDAAAWIAETKSNSMTFVAFDSPPPPQTVNLNSIDINTQVDFLFDLSVPFARLKTRSREILIDETTVLVASPQDLIVLKQNRSDRSPADEADIAFLKTLDQKT